jgi:hypothetical protein
MVQPIHDASTPTATSARTVIEFSSCVAAQPTAAAQYGIPAAITRMPVEAQSLIDEKRMPAERRNPPHGARLKAE